MCELEPLLVAADVKPSPSGQDEHITLLQTRFFTSQSQLEFDRSSLRCCIHVHYLSFVVYQRRLDWLETARKPTRCIGKSQYTGKGRAFVGLGSGLCYSYAMRQTLAEHTHELQNKTLLTLVKKRKLNTIADVVSLMTKMDRLLKKDDGLWWFNSLYRRVTLAIERDWEDGKWAHPAWLVQLDVGFAQQYFQAIEYWLTESDAMPRAWKPLFEWRYHSKIAPVQFALAGVNAHINRDLALAVVHACEKTKTLPERGTAEEADYIRVNQILEEVEVKAMQEMARGMLKFVTRHVNPLDKKLAMTFIGWARDVAWNNAENYWHWTHVLPNKDQALRVIKNMDWMAERMGRGILLPPSTIRGRTLL